MLDWVHARMAETARDPGLVLLALPVPAVPPERVFAWQGCEPAVFWEASRDRSWVGLGAAVALEAQGPERFHQIRSGAACHEANSHAWADAPSPVLRWFGGFAFAPGQCSSEPWIDFGDSSFILPRFLYERAETRASLVLATTPADRTGADARAAISERLRSLLTALAGSGPSSAEFAPVCGVAQSLEFAREDYCERVVDIQRAIAQGRLAKVVAAGRLVVHLPDEPGCEAVLGALRRQDPDSVVFGFRFGAACFVGASPERLVRQSGVEIETEAVAGSAPADGPASRAELLASPKNRWEHELVVDTLRRRLEPLCAWLELGPTPEVRALRRVLHLWTPIRGRLRKPKHILELVEHLHPSPAVGGVPVQGASDWILRHEPHARGWYSAPVGWFDGAGSGDFAVALRSGLFCDKRAYLFAGSGIVQRSDAEEELRETELKLRTLRSVLGVDMP
jgi:menaquinone-specific isochorismate synthase